MFPTYILQSSVFSISKPLHVSHILKVICTSHKHQVKLSLNPEPNQMNIIPFDAMLCHSLLNLDEDVMMIQSWCLFSKKMSSYT